LVLIKSHYNGGYIKFNGKKAAKEELECMEVFPIFLKEKVLK
jgi:hypothetical protein